MKTERNNPNQVSLLLRVLCGGYLLYTAWDLREAFQESPLFIISAVAFAIIGAVLGGVSLWQLIQAYRMTNSAAESETDENLEDCEEQSDD